MINFSMIQKRQQRKNQMNYKVVILKFKRIKMF